MSFFTSFSHFISLFFFLSRPFDFSEIGEYMSPGIYIYPFETQLASNLPTSCEGKHGFIRYLASANIIRPNATTQTQTNAFTVIKPQNLNALAVVQVRRVADFNLKSQVALLSYWIVSACLITPPDVIISLFSYLSPDGYIDNDDYNT